MFCCGENLGAERPAWNRCALSHMCVFCDKRVCVCVSWFVCPFFCRWAWRHLLSSPNITGSLNHSHPFTSICAWQTDTLPAWDRPETGKGSKAMCDSPEKVEGTYSELISQAKPCDSQHSLPPPLPPPMCWWRHFSATASGSVLASGPVSQSPCQPNLPISSV